MPFHGLWGAKVTLLLILRAIVISLLTLNDVGLLAFQLFKITPTGHIGFGKFFGRVHVFQFFLPNKKFEWVRDGFKIHLFLILPTPLLFADLLADAPYRPSFRRVWHVWNKSQQPPASKQWFY